MISEIDASASASPNLTRGLSPRFSNTGDGPPSVPGMGDIPLTYQLPPNERFRHGANDYFEPVRLTVRELGMIRIMNALTDKPNWNIKVFDDAIVDKWRVEAEEQCEEEGPSMTDRTWEWIIRELRDKAGEFERTGLVMGLDAGARVCKSDTIVGEDLRQEVKDVLGKLRGGIEEGDEDWHPGSGGKVLNLVHPSMYPLIYGRTSVLKHGGAVGRDDMMKWYGKGSILKSPDVPPDPASSDWYWPKPSFTRWSRNYQWLPCEVEFADPNEGTDVKITSYVNNLHPEHHAPVYDVLEKLIAKAIPAWNEVLIKGSNGRTPLRIRTFGAERDSEKPDWADDVYSYPEDLSSMDDAERKDYEEDSARVREYMRQPDRERPESEYSTTPRDDDLDSEWEFELGKAVKWKFERISSVVHPEPGIAYGYEDWREGRTRGVVVCDMDGGDGGAEEHTRYEVKLEEEFRRKGLQVIVKIAGTELSTSPSASEDRSTFDGGSWHIEGLINEHIVATAIYYYDVQNISPSTVYFRNEADMDRVKMRYEQFEHDDLAEVFGCEDGLVEGAEGVQELGGVETREGRMVVFPNTLQHCVGGFGLDGEDGDRGGNDDGEGGDGKSERAAKNGDGIKTGHRRMVVLWLVDPSYRILSSRNVPPQRSDWWAEEALEIRQLGNLPNEVTDMIAKEAEGWPMSREVAERERRKLMEERTVVMERIGEAVKRYNFCEH